MNVALVRVLFAHALFGARARAPWPSPRSSGSPGPSAVAQEQRLARLLDYAVIVPRHVWRMQHTPPIGRALERVTRPRRPRPR